MEEQSLNSNLILLIQKTATNTPPCFFALNSNLILLIPEWPEIEICVDATFKFQSDSINTDMDEKRYYTTVSFKFQSDSINTEVNGNKGITYRSLNSNLILLILIHQVPFL